MERYRPQRDLGFLSSLSFSESELESEPDSDSESRVEPLKEGFLFTNWVFDGVLALPPLKEP